MGRYIVTDCDKCGERIPEGEKHAQLLNASSRSISVGSSYHFHLSCWTAITDTFEVKK